MTTHFRICLVISLCCLLSFLAQAQKPGSRPLVTTTTSAVTKIAWSEWFKNSGTSTLEARYAKWTDNEITLELRNIGTGTMEGEFTANECPDTQKNINGWQKRSIEPGQSITLRFPTGGCNAGFHWWARNLNIWSNWFTLNPDNYISARWIKRGTQITVELLNSQNVSRTAQFSANFCEENFKAVNGWHTVQLPAKKTTVLKITDGSAGRCNAGFHLWYKNIRIPQIDSGTELNPVGN